MKALVIFSGGQDSTTCLGWALNRFKEVYAVSFAYGQKHAIEIEQAKKISKQLEIKHQIIDIGFLDQITDSALLKKDGDVNQMIDGMPASFVPNRNQLFITLAHALAQKLGCQHLITGVCQTDYSGYPDCRENFINSVEFTTNLGSFGEGKAMRDKYITLHAPLMNLSKSEIFSLAEQEKILPLIISESHTCYNGDREKSHDWGRGCGKCPACVLRREGYLQFTLRK